MFNTDDILTLAKAGFTSDQIIALGSIQTPQQAGAVSGMPATNAAPAPSQNQVQMQQPVQLQQPIQMQQPVQTPALYPQYPQYPQPEPQNVPQIANDPANAAFQKLFDEMRGVKSAIQNSNIANSSIQPKIETPDDVLASIIQPTNKNNEGGQN